MMLMMIGAGDENDFNALGTTSSRGKINELQFLVSFVLGDILVF